MSTHNIGFYEKMTKIFHYSVPFHLFGKGGVPFQLGKKGVKSQNWEKSHDIEVL